MDLVGAANWNLYKSLIGQDAHDTFQQDVVLMRRYTHGIDVFMEDGDNRVYDEIELKCQFAYNYFRQWKINVTTISGELDRSSQAAIFSVDYLKSQGILTLEEFFDYEVNDTIFTHRGVVYKPMGNTYISQAHDQPQLFMVVLQRQETATGLTPGTNDSSAV